MVFHVFPEDKIHFKWDNRIEPGLEVSSGDTVVYSLKDVTDGQITQSSSHDVIERMDWDRVYPLAGPLSIKGAEAGDVIEAEMLDIHTKGWGWSAIIPGFGLLEEFNEPKLKIWDLSNGDFTYFNKGIKIPLDPFCGTMGVAPSDRETREVMPPGRHGGNMDIRHLTKGSKLFLPVQVDGGLFSVGDGHAAQGDGEVCVTAIEAPLDASIKFKLHKKMKINTPHFVTPGPLTSKYDEAGYYATVGISNDLMEAAQEATSSLLDYVCRTRGLERWEAYMLCSIVADLKISEIVDKPNYIVSAYLPLSIFE
jgi:acetamidase/formamidase